MTAIEIASEPRLDADHPSNRVPIPCRSTFSSTVPRRRTASGASDAISRAGQSSGGLPPDSIAASDPYAVFAAPALRSVSRSLTQA